jgi:hypothetical protein
MPKLLNETATYTENKRQIFAQLLKAIEQASKKNESRIYLKHIKIMEEEVDVIAEESEWSTVLSKATTFFESIEDYEMCHKCKKIKDKLAKK